MLPVLSIVLALGLSQAASAPEPDSAPASDGERSAVRAAEAAERAASAARSAAESAERAAKAAERIAQAAAPDAPPSTQPAPETAVPESKQPATPAWSCTLSAGLISLTGNTETITTTGAFAASRLSETWIFSVKGNGAYGQTRPVDAEIDPETVALNANLELRADRRITERYSIYLLGGATTDHVKSIEAFPYGEAGLSILWLDDREGDFVRLRLQTDLAFRYGEELRFQYYPTPQDLEDVIVAAPKLGIIFRYAINQDVIFTEDLEVLPTVLGPSRVLVNSTSKIAARVVSALSVGVSFIVKHDSDPAEGKLPTDTALNVGLEIGF